MSDGKKIRATHVNGQLLLEIERLGGWEMRLTLAKEFPNRTERHVREIVKAVFGREVADALFPEKGSEGASMRPWRDVIGLWIPTPLGPWRTAEFVYNGRELIPIRAAMLTWTFVLRSASPVRPRILRFLGFRWKREAAPLRGAIYGSDAELIFASEVGPVRVDGHMMTLYGVEVDPDEVVDVHADEIDPTELAAAIAEGGPTSNVASVMAAVEVLGLGSLTDAGDVGTIGGYYDDGRSAVATSVTFVGRYPGISATPGVAVGARGAGREDAILLSGLARPSAVDADEWLLVGCSGEFQSDVAPGIIIRESGAVPIAFRLPRYGAAPRLERSFSRTRREEFSALSYPIDYLGEGIIDSLGFGTKLELGKTFLARKARGLFTVALDYASSLGATTAYRGGADGYSALWAARLRSGDLLAGAAAGRREKGDTPYSGSEEVLIAIGEGEDVLEALASLVDDSLIAAYLAASSSGDEIADSEV